jgi:hypothetical protein
MSGTRFSPSCNTVMRGTPAQFVPIDRAILNFKALWFRRALLSPKGTVPNFIGTLIVGMAKTLNYFKWAIPPSKFDLGLYFNCGFQF